jgi:hypothetical protein
VTTTNGKTIETLHPVTGDGLTTLPYSVHVELEGQADMLCHRWSNESVATKAAAAKNSAAKKTDDVASYVYRDDANNICIPNRYLQRSIVEAGRFHQDPRSPRKSALDLMKAAVIVTPPLAPILVGGEPTDDWDYLDRQRVQVQRNAITRERPAFRAGWRLRYEITVLLPDYVSPIFLRRLVDDAGRFIGLGDFRPSYGRFSVVRWDLMAQE